MGRFMAFIIRGLAHADLAVSRYQDPRFAKNADRVRHRAVLVPLLEVVMRRIGV